MDSNELAVYTRLLGIPTEKCPPTYYTLLGLEPNEPDTNAIVAAAKAQTNRLRKNVPHELHASVLAVAKTISRARICLSDRDARAAYDQSIGFHHNAEEEKPSLISGGGNEGLVSPDEGSLLPPLILEEFPLDLTSDDDSLWVEDEIPELPPTRFALSSAPATRKPANGRSSKSNTSLFVIGGSVLAVTAALLVAMLWRSPSATIGHTASSDRSEASNRQQSSRPESENQRAVATAETTVVPVEVLEEADPSPEEDALRPRDQSPTQVEVTTDRVEVPPSMSLVEPAAATSKVLSADAKPKAKAGEAVVFDLQDSVTLPGYARSYGDAAESASAKVVSLGAISHISDSDLKFAIYSPSHGGQSASTFDVMKIKDRPSGSVWGIRFGTQDIPGTPDRRSALASHAKTTGPVIAGLRVRDGRLEFAWGKGDAAAAGGQLRNCAIHVSAGKLEGRVGLSESGTIDALTLDLEQPIPPIQVHHFPLPPEPTLRCELVAALFAGVATEVDPPSQQIGCGETLTLKIVDWQDGEWVGDLEVRVRFNASRDGRSAELEVQPRFRMGRGWKPLEAEEIESLARRSEIDLRKARAELNSARSEISSLPGRIASLRAAATRNSGSNPGAVRELSSAQSALKRANSRAGRLSRSIPKIEEGIAHLRQLESIRRSLHQKARLQFRVFVQLVDGELSLLHPDESSTTL
ncbi:hypothetical protein KOR34_04890 [Posidoniimonas corsicana]|uniref:J domain-containing protein n=1 Tax=Posidoniimonas corsicana TaxID=1938618 RepID=A0A5C5VAH2_9BACT|nr:hypothetical protein [Posidoniimonas corsicana]TWT35596.1 hypothetical protein KOR34_04890 [Posidoniimonas corsicana]